MTHVIDTQGNHLEARQTIRDERGAIVAVECMTDINTSTVRAVQDISRVFKQPSKDDN